MKKYEISIIDIQEHRMVFDEEIKFMKVNNFHLITIFAYGKTAHRQLWVVKDFLLRRNVESALSKMELISPSIMKATFAGNPGTTIIEAYAPINAPTSEVETEPSIKIFEKLLTARHITIFGPFSET